VPPEVKAKVADSPAAVPVVFWFRVGNVQFVSVPEDGVPSAGVTSDGEVERTTEPEPVEVVAPVPPLPTGSVPETCDARPILPHDGAVFVPPEMRALPAATAASFDSDVVVSAYTVSPTV
jgi:hypothetical protein